MRYDRQQMQRLLSAVSVVATQLTTAETIGEIELISSDTQASLLKLGTGPVLDYDQSVTFVSLFRQQVDNVPEAIAHLTLRKVLAQVLRLQYLSGNSTVSLYLLSVDV